MRTSCSDPLTVLVDFIILMVHGEEYSHNASYYSYILLSGPELLPVIKRASVIHHSNAHKLGSSKADEVRFVKLTNSISGTALCVRREKM